MKTHTLFCEVCGKEFLVPTWRVKKAKYCSHKCFGVAAKGTPNAICTQCGKPFHLKPYRQNKYARREGFFCSKECLSEHKKEFMLGCGNHQYGLKGPLNKSFKGLSILRKNHNNNDIMVYVPDHPFRDKDGRVYYHRYLVEQNSTCFDMKYFTNIDGRVVLKPEFVVHHKDGNHDNNDISNLEVLTRGEHSSIHNASNEINRDVITGRFTQKIVIPFKKLYPDAKEPYRASDGAAGYDLYAHRVEQCGINICKCYTGIAVQIPQNYCGLLLPRSSVVKTGMFLGNGCGLLDSDYTGELVFVFYKRDGSTPYTVGDRIGQLIIIPIPKIEFEEVEELDETERGDGGFGSTGR